YPVRLDEHGGVAQVIRTGKPLLMPEITEETLESGSRDAEHLRLLRSIDMGSAIAVPMTAGAKTVGAIVFANDRGSRGFDRGDLATAIELARRVGLAAENARLAGEQAEVARVLQRGLL